MIWVLNKGFMLYANSMRYTNVKQNFTFLRARQSRAQRKGSPISYNHDSPIFLIYNVEQNLMFLCLSEKKLSLEKWQSCYL